jgi:transposase
MADRQQEGAPMSRKRGEEYSQDLRDRVLEASGPIRRVADLFRVSASYVSKVASRFRLTGVRTTKRRGGQRQPILAGREDLLRERLKAVPDATLEELQRWLLETQGIKISIGALWNALHRMGLRFKKNPARRRAGAARGAAGARGLAGRAAQA